MLKKYHYFGFLTWLLFQSFITFTFSQVTFLPTKLRTESRENPLGIDQRNPQLSWQMTDSRRGAKQTAYQILVASTEKKLQNNTGDKWDSGKINSDQSVHIFYKGLALRSGKRYFWKVKIWDAENKPSVWSETAEFETGFLETNDWKARWIGQTQKLPPDDIPNGNWIWHPTISRSNVMVYFRKNFQLPAEKEVTQILLKTAIDNSYEIKLNGIKITEIRQGYPGKSLRFYRHDLTRFVKDSENLLTVAALKTNSEKQGGFICTIQFVFSDKTSQCIFSDDTWACNTTERTGWISEMPIAKWTKAKILENYGGKIWGKIGEAYQPMRSQLIRKLFIVNKKIERARVYVTGLGSYYLFINGQQVSKDLFAPGWTHYPKRIQYQTYDVTNLLKTGANTVGAMLGNMWWSGDIGYRGLGQYSENILKFLFQLQVDYDDGTSETIISDNSWKTKPSPILFNSIYDGETYDAREEMPDWTKTDFQDTDWSFVESFNDSKNNLVAEQVQPIQEIQEIAPREVKEISPGKFVYDFGQNIVGFVRLKVKNATAGRKITLRFAETLRSDGSLRTEPQRSAKCTDEYICSGKGVEIWQPKFTYHGFQYVEITGFPDKPDNSVLTGIVVHTNAPQRGVFTCSDETVNKIQEAVHWSLRGNMFGVLTASPHGDERLAWTGDTQVFATTAYYYRQMALFFDKYVKDIADCQRADGEVMNVNPNAFNEGIAQAGWADAIVILPWRVWTFTGNKQILEDNYPAMVKWHKKKETESEGNLREFGGFGDWVSVEPTSSEAVSSAYYFYTTHLLSRIAEVLGKTEDAKNYKILSEKIAFAYNEKHFNQSLNRYDNGSQTANLLPLAMGIAPEKAGNGILKNLVEDIRKHETHLTTGIIGTQYLLPILSRYGQHELALQLATQYTYPSWGYMLEHQANTIWERWNGDKILPELEARNHYALGSVAEWFFGYLGGVRPMEEVPGFKKILIAPRPAGNLTYALTRLETQYGLVICKWEKKAGELLISISIPANTTAQVILPTLIPEKVSENEQFLFKVQGVSNIQSKNGFTTFDLGAGKYMFRVAL